MSKWIVDIRGDIEGDYKIIEEYKEPKMGCWIYKGYYECSECGQSTYLDKPNYCPNCGAQMREDNFLIP